MVTRKIYIGIWGDDIPEDKALMLAQMALQSLPDKKGIVSFTDGSMASFNERAKNTTIHIWKDRRKTD